MVTAEEIRQLQKACEQEFIDRKKGEVLALIESTAKDMKFSIDVKYYSLLDSFYQELLDNGFMVEVKLSTLTISW